MNKKEKNYAGALKEVIKIEKELGKEEVFSEGYIRQLERRIEIYEAGKSEVIKHNREIIKWLKSIVWWNGHDRAWIEETIKRLEQTSGELK